MAAPLWWQVMHMGLHQEICACAEQALISPYGIWEVPMNSKTQFLLPAGSVFRGWKD